VFACGSTPVSSRFPGDTRTVTVSCLLRASARTVLKALESGAARVVFTGCVESTCRYPYARDLGHTSAEKIRATLKDLGMEDAFVVIGGEVEEEDTVHCDLSSSDRGRSRPSAARCRDTSVSCS
jgi:coenzyme F420-reducing hydrogenase delta subunit